ncbi:MAG: phosphate ABC transporter substrate-binding protein PstS [Antricoccus sp.]
MKLNKTYAVASIFAAGTLALSACSDNTSTTSSGANNGSATNAGSSTIKCGTGALNASGSSAQAKAIDTWQAKFAAICPDMTINYDPAGSGQGVKDFIAAKTDFAGSDSAVKDADKTAADARCSTGKAINLPMVIAPVAIAYNLKGVDKLILNGEVTADIFEGKITTWNDPAIAALNKGVKLPSSTITTIHRSKDSGTTDNFTKFLAAASNGKWTFPGGKSWSAPGGQGAPDSAGVVAAVKSNDGSIAYVDGPDAKGNSLSTAALDSGSGPVTISDASVGKAVSAAKTTGTGNDLVISLAYDLKEAGAYPAVQVTYEIVCEKGLAADKTKSVKAFMTYAATDGQKELSALGYSPLPAELQTKVADAIKAIS